MVRLLLPRDDDGIVFARIWLAICEAGRSDLSVAAATTYGESEQLAMIEGWLPEADESEIRAVYGLVTGLRTQLCAPEPISLEDAHTAASALRPGWLRCERISRWWLRCERSEPRNLRR